MCKIDIGKDCTVIEPELPQNYLDDMFVLNIYIDSLIRQEMTLDSYNRMSVYDLPLGKVLCPVMCDSECEKHSDI